MPEPLVSVIIVNHNGVDFIANCLHSVLNSNYAHFEIIVVDNASMDRSLEYIKREFVGQPRLRIVENKASVGPAVGRNCGSRVANGKYLFFLDNDTRIEKNCITELVRVMERDASIGSAQAKLLRMDSNNFYDCAGDYLGPLGFLIERSRAEKDIGQFDFITDILSAKSAASIIRKELFDKIGGFDEDFYMYLEETDLSWRVWLSGLRVVFIPQAVVYHAFNTVKKDFRKYYSGYLVRYYGCRNYITTLIKNLQFINLIKVLPLHICSWLAIAFLFLLKGKPRDSFYILKGVFWNALNIKTLIKKHRANNVDIRKVNDGFILKKVASREGIENYFKKVFSYLNINL